MEQGVTRLSWAFPGVFMSTSIGLALPTQPVFVFQCETGEHTTPGDRGWKGRLFSELSSQKPPGREQRDVMIPVDFAHVCCEVREGSLGKIFIDFSSFH